MKKIFLTTVAIGLLTAPCVAQSTWFVGAGLGYAQPVLSDVLDNQIDDDFWNDKSGTVNLALTGGMRFGHRNNIYNGGISATLSYMPELVRLSDGNSNPYYMDANLDFTTLYLSYDNYIRVSGNSKFRTDFIASVGVGYGWLKESLEIEGYETETSNDNGLLIVLKFGFGGETKFKGLGWNAAMTMTFLNAESDADLQGQGGFNVGLTYTF